MGLKGNALQENNVMLIGNKERYKN